MERLTKRINLGDGQTTVDFSNVKMKEFFTDHEKGVRALFEKVAEYEDMEEQGVLLRQQKINETVKSLMKDNEKNFDDIDSYNDRSYAKGYAEGVHDGLLDMLKALGIKTGIVKIKESIL